MHKKSMMYTHGVHCVLFGWWMTIKKNITHTGWRNDFDASFSWNWEKSNQSTRILLQCECWIWRLMYFTWLHSVGLQKIGKVVWYGRCQFWCCQLFDRSKTFENFQKLQKLSITFDVWNVWKIPHVITLFKTYKLRIYFKNFFHFLHWHSSHRWIYN